MSLMPILPAAIAKAHNSKASLQGGLPDIFWPPSPFLLRKRLIQNMFDNSQGQIRHAPKTVGIFTPLTTTRDLLRRVGGSGYRNGRRHQIGVSSFGDVLASRQIRRRGTSCPIRSRAYLQTDQRSVYAFKNMRRTGALRSCSSPAKQSAEHTRAVTAQGDMGTILELVNYAGKQ